MMTCLIQYKGAIPSELAKRELNAILRAGYHQLGVYWVANFRAKHFTNAGATEYGYTPRKGERGSGRAWKGSYTARKLKKFGHTRPLEWSGRSKERTRAARVQAYSANKKSRVEIRMNATALNFKAKGSTINMRDEMTRLSKQENTILTRLLGRYLSGRFKAVTASRTVQAS